MRRSNALDLEPGIFASTDPRRIALSLKQSAESSTRRKATPFRSAMSMLNFYINRAGTSLSARQRRVLEHAKRELRGVFGRPPSEPIPRRRAGRRGKTARPQRATKTAAKQR